MFGPGTVVWVGDASIYKAKAERSRIQDQPGLHGKALSQEKEEKRGETNGRKDRRGKGGRERERGSEGRGDDEITVITVRLGLGLIIVTFKD